MKSDLDLLYSSSIVPRNTPIKEIQLFLKVCEELCLSPYRKEVHLLDRYNSEGKKSFYTIVGIGGYRHVAAKSGKYAGIDDPVYNDSKSAYQIRKDGDEIVSCTVTVWRMIEGVRVAFTATALWDEYVPFEHSRNRKVWDEKPTIMISKVAESLALRKAFSDFLSGTYIEEELSQLDDKEAREEVSQKKMKSKTAKGLASVMKKVKKKP
jgi:phage recombination protein Bet